MSNPCLLFDPDCPMCLRFKQAIERIPFDEEISFRSIYDENLLEDFPFLEKSDFHKEVHLVVDQDPPQVLVGAEVIEYLAMHNPQVKKLAWLLDTKVGEKASQVFYQSLNKIRQSLQNHCPKCKKKES